MNDLNILILDDDRLIRKELEESLTDYSFQITTSEKPSDALRIISESVIDILILDIDLPEMSGLEVLKRVKQEHPYVEVIMITGHSDMDFAIQALRLGAADFFLKPFSIAEVVIAIKKTERFKRLNSELNFAVQQNRTLLASRQKEVRISGRSKQTLHVLAQMNQLSQFPETTVLITGESGTGKELIAKGIHNLGERKNEICHAVNCAAIPENLLESELFGHMKGTFTGAIETQIGCFELAKNGTLILDEVTEMPLHIQAKFLRVLEEREVSKLGSHRMIQLNSRIIATSNRNLQELVEKGEFREDLYHRLNVFHIHVTPLRERKDDIPDIAKTLTLELCKKLRKTTVKLDNSAMHYLQQYDFPGNVRELRNILERVLILSRTGFLSSGDFDFLKSSLQSQNQATPDYNLMNNEKRLIMEALKACNGNKKHASKLMGITWQSLDRRIKKHNISIHTTSTIQ